jgi:hypothetical protein
MPNPIQIEVLRQGAESWNAWRTKNPNVPIDLKWSVLENQSLIGADLSNANLTGGSLGGVDLRGANLRNAILENVTLENANLVDVDLTDADIGLGSLISANLSNASLVRAKLTDGYLTFARLRNANLEGANLEGCDLGLAEFSETNLEKAIFNKTRCYATIFSDVDLSKAIGLDTVRHDGPSTIGIDTFFRSKGSIPMNFLQGAGVPESLIKFARSLSAKPINFYSCFISYSSKDEDFAARLHNDLRVEGVRCWFAPEDLKMGDKLHEAIDGAIQRHDKLLLVLSEYSIESAWVEREVRAALKQEAEQKSLVLFPVRLDDAVTETTQQWAYNLRRTRNIGDFRNWREPNSYQKTFNRLLRDLKTETHP